MNRQTVPYAALVIDKDGQPYVLQLERPGKIGPVSDLVGFPVRTIHSGYDVVTDSSWSSYCAEGMDLDVAVAAIREYNRTHLLARFPSVVENQFG